MEEKLRVLLGKSTFLLGVADPGDVLAPGEVHVQFLKLFLDDFYRRTHRNLEREENQVTHIPKETLFCFDNGRPEQTRIRTT
jgi:hypothetical protein